MDDVSITAGRSTSARLEPFDDVRASGAWRSWVDLAGSAPPFLTPEFFALSQPLCDAGEALFVEARVGERLVGALPLVRQGRTLLALSSEHSPAFDYRGTIDGIDATWRALERDRRWDVLTLKNVPATSLLATRFVERARASGARVVLRPGARHAHFLLKDFESRLSSKFLTNLRRCERKAGGVELERVCVPGRSDFAEALAIEAMAWKGALGTSIETDPRVTHLYAALARLFGRRGRANLYFLRAGGRRVATLLCVEDDKCVYALKIGYDPRQAAVSPGHLMVWKVAQQAERRGLEQLDFVGHDDAWKRKWTDQVHEHVTPVIYRRSARGLALSAAREVVRPGLAKSGWDPRTPLRHGCQRDDRIGRHSFVERVRARLARGLGVKSSVRRLFAPPKPPRDPLGAASRFAPGDWVRVVEPERVRATLDRHGRDHGLSFVPTQWETCGGVYRVSRLVRRIRDDHGSMRPIGHTVLVEGVTCAGCGVEPAGCGRHCPLMFRDAWLEPADAPRREPPGPSAGRHARVRSVEQIKKGLDLHGRRDGLMFMPEMAGHAGKRFRVLQRLPRVFEYDRWVETRTPIYTLEGLNCSGAILKSKGPCDRACALLWHADWLDFEPDAAA
jgi:CelD/BcsL family acetyltransferase involved in cellulose biosynthesis